MAPIYVDPGIAASGPPADRQRLDECLRALEACGKERLTPLAQHMAVKRLVRARGDAGAPLRHLDVQVLRKALSRMLYHEWEDGYLIYQLVVDGAEPGQVAAERGVSRATLVEQLRDAVGSLACRYEHLANGYLNDWPVASLRAALGGKRG
jgi:hypothetical protein